MANIASKFSQRKFWTEFIQLYKEHPCLWDVESAEHLKKPLKDLAFNLLLEKYWELDGTATMDTIKKKILIFRSGFRREYRKKQEAKLAGTSYVSKLWYYQYFKFLGGSQDSSDEENDDLSDRESPQPSTSEAGKEEHFPVVVQNTPATWVVAPPTPVPPVYQSLPRIAGVSSIAQDTQTAQPSTSRTAPISAVIDKVVQDNFEEQEEDDCSTFAAHIKMRMRRFDNAQKVIAQKLISDILFMADTKQLNLASAVVNPQAQAAQFAQAVHDAQVTHSTQLAQVPQAVNNIAKKAVGSTFSAFVIDSDDDSGPVIKRQK